MPHTGVFTFSRHVCATRTGTAGSWAEALELLCTKLLAPCAKLVGHGSELRAKLHCQEVDAVFKRYLPKLQQVGGGGGGGNRKGGQWLTRHVALLCVGV